MCVIVREGPIVLNSSVNLVSQIPHELYKYVAMHNTSGYMCKRWEVLLLSFCKWCNYDDSTLDKDS